jgi:hypothetical protein
MVHARTVLIAGGSISAAIAALHILLTFVPAWWEPIAGGTASVLADLAEQGSPGTRAASLVLALVFSVWALYAFSGAGFVRPLPWLRAVLIAVGVIYLLRGLAIIPEVSMVRSEGYPGQYVVFSSISLLAGGLYLVGAWMLRGLRHPGDRTAS